MLTCKLKRPLNERNKATKYVTLNYVEKETILITKLFKHIALK
jgi:hypothetical protein